MRGDDLADGVAEKKVWREAPGFEEPEERDLKGEEGGLSEGGLVEQGSVIGAFLGEDDVAQRPMEHERGTGLGRRE
jgi:hypothetical protein